MLRTTLIALTATLMISSAYADSTPPAPPPGTGHGMMRGMFTQDERMMLITDMFKATQGMTDDQKHAYRKGQRDRIMAMSDADRAKFKADLDARWAALPADRKAAIPARIQAFMAARMAGSGGASAQ